MVGFLKRGNSLDKLLHGRGGTSSKAIPMSEGHSAGLGMGEEKAASRGQGGKGHGQQNGGWAEDRADRMPKSRLNTEGGGAGKDLQHSDMQLMKEKFAKLLLGEDMSGGGKGVSSALALSNAVTNLAASIFAEQRRLEPMAQERKARWRKEIDWLLSVTDHIVQLVPSQQESQDGTQMEVMTTRQRTDLHMNIPALRKLDAMLIDYLDNFKDQNEFWYAKASEESDKGQSQRKDDKWWLPIVKVPEDGLSEVTRRWLLFQKDSVHQVLKAAMAINAQVLLEMEIPDVYIESLPKNGKTSLGDAIYKSITLDTFDPDQFLSTIDLSTEHKIVDLKNRIEASVVIWRRKMHDKNGKSSWGSAVSLEKRELFEERAETILIFIKQRFPGIPQSTLDISKIQYNKDVGHAVLESYSRVLESLAYTVMSQIEDVLETDAAIQNPSAGDSKRRISVSDTGPVKILNPKEEIEKLNNMDPPMSMTLSDFMGWHLEQEPEAKKKHSDEMDDNASSENGKLGKPSNINTNRKFSYIESLGGMRSPTWK